MSHISNDTTKVKKTKQQKYKISSDLFNRYSSCRSMHTIPMVFFFFVWKNNFVWRKNVEKLFYLKENSFSFTTWSVHFHNWKKDFIEKIIKGWHTIATFYKCLPYRFICKWILKLQKKTSDNKSKHENEWNSRFGINLFVNIFLIDVFSTFFRCPICFS